MSIERVGRIVDLWRFPVKSMLGERVETVEATEVGIVGDRAYALIDRQTGKVVSAKHPRLWPDLFGCRAHYVRPPQAGQSLPPVRIELADGTSPRSDDADVDAVLSRFFGREVHLARLAPADYTIDEYHPDLEQLNPAGERDVLVEMKLGSALFALLGWQSAVPEGSFMDLFPVSILTTSTLDHLAGLAPDSDFDFRRFRMNLIIETPTTGFAENTWVGSALHIGNEVEFAVPLPTPRCVMTTLAQEELPADPGVLRTIVKNNRLALRDVGKYPCAGAYATTTRTGTIRTGDTVALAQVRDEEQVLR
ncbi:MAG TPA: MOSC N-terminal beta barrel domain-containing protein [Pseudonocardia sp.]|uniref:MOSC domain-containing protein n=1 Tax=Pseudonocardia sp. TaxID=60912 RepID=UPI002CF86258|nr:MOSC N-terminal beta barrel domain-containing protein [Pseudonocardia sp.]HTF53845.1 MOSC N-terminal beta barrel domain-containing protein [Pseudonocardia sp.]